MLEKSGANLENNLHNLLTLSVCVVNDAQLQSTTTPVELYFFL